MNSRSDRNQTWSREGARCTRVPRELGLAGTQACVSDTQTGGLLAAPDRAGDVGFPDQNTKTHFLIVKEKKS